MTKHDDDDLRQVDLYGLKLPYRTAPLDDANAPITWDSLKRDIGQSILRACRDSAGLIADIFTGARSLVRGVDDLPSAIASRVRGAHQLATARELEAQQGTIVSTPEAKAESLDQLEAFVNELRAVGVSVEILQLPDGQTVIAAGQPISETEIREIADRACENTRVSF